MPSLNAGGVIAALFVVAATAPAFCQLPQTHLGGVFPPGGTAGTTLDVQVVGTNNVEYETAPRLIFSHPGIVGEASLDAASGAWHENAFRVTVAPDVPPGRYEVCLDGFYGASIPRSFRVESGSCKVEAGETPSQAAIALDEPLYGRLEIAADVDAFTFSGESGQTIVVRCDAALLDSALQPVVELVAPNGRTIAMAGGPYRGEALCGVTLPTSGEYTVRVTDAAYRGGADFAYRLVATVRPVISSIWPPAAVPGQTASLDLYGYNLPGGEPVSEESPLVRRSVEITVPAEADTPLLSTVLRHSQAIVAGVDYSFREGESASEPHPIFFCPQRLMKEIESNDDPLAGESIAVPAEIAGRFDRRGDADRFVFEAKKGDVFFAEVFAERYGSPTDPVITIERLAGADAPPRQIATQDDQAEVFPEAAFSNATRDPQIRFESPEDGTYRITVRDRYFASRGGPELSYRLSVRRPAPGFELAVVPFTRAKADAPATAASVVLRKGESLALPVVALRRDGFDGPIAVQATGLSPGLTCAGVTIERGMNAAPLVLTASSDAPTWRGAITIVGEAALSSADGTVQPLKHNAVTGTLIGDGTTRPIVGRLSGPLVVSIQEEVVPYRLEGIAGEVRVAVGSQVLIPLRLVRNGDAVPTEAIAIAVEGIAGDAKVAVEAKPFEPGVSEQLARLVIDPQAPPRSQAVLFKGTSKIDFTPFPHRLKRAKAGQQDLIARLAQAQEAVAMETMARDAAVQAAAAAEQTKQVAEQAAVAATAEVERIRTEVGGVETALAEMTAVEPAADESTKSMAAQVVAQRTAELDQVRQRLSQADQVSAVAATGVTEATAALATAQTLVVEREAAVKAAEEERTRVEAAKAAADQAVADAEKAATPRKIDAAMPTAPITLTVVPALAELTIEVANGGQVKRGETVDVKVSAKRAAGFAGAIGLSLVVPEAARSLSAAPVTITAEQTEAVVRVVAGSDAAEGDVPFPAVRATFDAPEAAPLDRPFALKVVP